MAKSKQHQTSKNIKADKTTEPEMKKSDNKKNSEIDDIFATKKIAKTPAPDDKDQVEPTLTKQQKRKQKKKAAAAAEATAAATETKTAKATTSESSDSEQEDDEQEQHKVQEVIFAQLAAAQSLKRKAAPPPPVSADNDLFGDSRGKKAKRTTDDGYPLYDVKDLRIGEGQDTPDCPFDCQCCF